MQPPTCWSAFKRPRTSQQRSTTGTLVLICLLLLVVLVRVADAAANSSYKQAGTAGKKRPVPLALPNDPNVNCGKDVFLKLTATYSCPWEHYPAENPDEGCCEGLSLYFGLNASKPSKHCLCTPEVWNRLTKEEEYHRLPLSRILKYCNHAGAHVIPFYQDGAGYCNGTADDAYARQDYDAHYHTEAAPAPAFSSWVSRLSRSWIMQLSFVSSIASVPGFLMFLWPFLFDAYHTIKESGTARLWAHAESCKS